LRLIQTAQFISPRPATTESVQSGLTELLERSPGVIPGASQAMAAQQLRLAYAVLTELL
jgi:hypothetical protein